MRPFTYARPATQDDLLTLLRAHGPRLRLLAGGTDLLVRLRLGRLQPDLVVDIKRVDTLRDDVRVDAGWLRIGARALMGTVAADARVQRHLPALAEAARVVGSAQIRNRATLVGNICNASPAADTAPALLVYEARVRILGGSAGAGAERHVPISDFFTGPGRTVLAPDEIVSSIDVPLPDASTGAAFGRVTRRYGVDLATLNLCCLVTTAGETRFAFGAVGPRPLLVRDASGDLADPSLPASRQAARLEELLRATAPISDVRAARDYRLAMLAVISRRALTTALARRASGGAAPSDTRPFADEGGPHA